MEPKPKTHYMNAAIDTSLDADILCVCRFSSDLGAGEQGPCSQEGEVRAGQLRFLTSIWASQGLEERVLSLVLRKTAGVLAEKSGCSPEMEKGNCRLRVASITGSELGTVTLRTGEAWDSHVHLFLNKYALIHLYILCYYSITYVVYI